MSILGIVFVVLVTLLLVSLILAFVHRWRDRQACTCHRSSKYGRGWECCQCGRWNARKMRRCGDVACGHVRARPDRVSCTKVRGRRRGR